MACPVGLCRMTLKLGFNEPAEHLRDRKSC
jgi:hypothetical protein